MNEWNENNERIHNIRKEKIHQLLDEFTIVLDDFLINSSRDYLKYGELTLSIETLCQDLIDEHIYVSDELLLKLKLVCEEFEIKPSYLKEIIRIRDEY
jgi:hypothetical protein